MRLWTVWTRRGQSARGNLTHAESRMESSFLLFVDNVDSIFRIIKKFKYVLYIYNSTRIWRSAVQTVAPISLLKKDCPQPPFLALSH